MPNNNNNNETQYYLYSPNLAFGEAKFPMLGSARVQSFQFLQEHNGAAASGPSAVSNRGASQTGRRFAFEKPADTTTVGLWRAMSNATPIPTVTLDAWSDASCAPAAGGRTMRGGAAAPAARRLLTRVVMSDVVVESVTGLPPFEGGGPRELYILNYIGIRFEAFSCDSKDARSRGLSGGNAGPSWNLRMDRGA